MSDKYQRAAKAVIEAVGGAENIRAATHCATRLRLVLADESKINTDRLDQEEMVKGHFLTSGQFQIIIGTGLVNHVHKALLALTGAKEVSKDEAKALAGSKGNIVQRFIKVLSDIFVPIIPAIVAGGLLMGLNNILTAEGLFYEGMSFIQRHPEWASIADMINTFANAPFVFLPVLIAFSATRIFGGNPFLGAALGMIMVHPALTNNYALAETMAQGNLQYWHLLGFEIAKVGYQGTVLPILVCSWILSKIELNVRKVMPTSIDLLLTPLIALMATAFLTFTFVGPITRDAGEWFTNAIAWLYNSSGVFGGALLGLIYAPIVITGMHNSFIPVETQLIANRHTTGGTFIFPIAAMNNVAQGAAAFATLFTSKDKKLKGIASASGISAVLGITEPAMFGVNLKLRYPFYAALIGTSIAAGYITAFGTKAVSLGAAGLPGVISIDARFLLPYVTGMVISFVVTFSLTILLAKVFAKKEAALAMESVSNDHAQETHQAEGVSEVSEDGLPEIPEDFNARVIQGQLLSLDKVPDPAFSQGIMGAGFAIAPSGGEVRSPVNGTVSAVFPSKHALGITADNGLEVLIHVGLDTVKLDGKGFEVLVEEGQSIKVGDALLKVDWDFVQEHAPSIVTPVIFTQYEGDDWACVVDEENAQVRLHQKS